MKILLPIERWKERTNDGKSMSAGWTSAKYDPPANMVDYEVRGCSEKSILTWGYGQWWHQAKGVNGFVEISSPWVSHGDARYAWRGPVYHSCHANWGDVMVKAAKAGNEQAKADIKRAQIDWDERMKRETL